MGNTIHARGDEASVGRLVAATVRRTGCANRNCGSEGGGATSVCTSGCSTTLTALRAPIERAGGVYVETRELPPDHFLRAQGLHAKRRYLFVLD